MEDRKGRQLLARGGRTAIYESVCVTKTVEVELVLWRLRRKSDVDWRQEDQSSPPHARAHFNSGHGAVNCPSPSKKNSERERDRWARRCAHEKNPAPTLARSRYLPPPPPPSPPTLHVFARPRRPDRSRGARARPPRASVFTVSANQLPSSSRRAANRRASFRLALRPMACLGAGYEQTTDIATSVTTLPLPWLQCVRDGGWHGYERC